VIHREALARLPLFADVAPRVVGALASRGVEVAFDADEVIFVAGAPPRGWFVVLDGLVRVVSGNSARQHVIHTEGAGGTLAEVPLFTGATHPATGIAAEPTRCALFDRQSLEAAIAECPEIAFLLAKRLALRVETLVARLEARSARSVRVRLIDFLLQRASQARRNSFSLGMTHQKLAEELGTVREVVVRELRKLRDDRLIEAIEHGRYRILDWPALQGVSDSASN
jgi:CRP/FNR family cyclic AMP-dependent transcriptional regulator